MPRPSVNATMAFSPIPAASASGKFATTPIRMDMTPATRAVPAAIAAGEMCSGAMTPRMDALTTRM